MKRIALLSAALLLVSVSEIFSQNTFTVSGSIREAELNGNKIYLQQLDSTFAKRINIDSTTIANGKFSFSGKVAPQVQFAFISLEKPIKKIRGTSFILEDGNINILLDTLSNVSGTKMNNDYQTFINTQMQTAENDDMDLYIKSIFDFASQNIKNPVGEYILMSNHYVLGPDELKVLLPQVSEKLKKNSRFKKIELRAQALENTAIGKSFTDLTSKTPEGSTISLSDYAGKGKYLLVDFWASWCGPCRKEMPHLVDAYAKYKDKGLEIVGVSLDQDADAWKGYLEKANMTWPQMSDLKGWNSELAAPYGVMSIPSTVLIDKDGKIIAKNLMGAKLFSRLDELFK